jgi:hypothetical protein
VLDLECDEALSKFAFNFNLRRYNQVDGNASRYVAARLGSGTMQGGAPVSKKQKLMLGDGKVGWDY